MLNRKIYSYLRNFFKNEKKALLVEGARQVGKTYAIRKTGSECFKNVGKRFRDASRYTSKKYRSSFYS